MSFNIYSDSIEAELEKAITESDPVSPVPNQVLMPAPENTPLENLGRRISIMSYELKFKPGGQFSHLKPDPKHPVYDS